MCVHVHAFMHACVGICNLVGNGSRYKREYYCSMIYCTVYCFCMHIATYMSILLCSVVRYLLLYSGFMREFMVVAKEIVNLA